VRDAGVGCYSQQMSFLTLVAAIVIAGLILRHFGMILEIIGAAIVLIVVLALLS
jgi:hypothetical protein